MDVADDASGESSEFDNRLGRDKPDGRLEGVGVGGGFWSSFGTVAD